MEYRLDSPQLTEDERALIKSSANLNHLLTSKTVAAAAAAAAASGGAQRSAKSFGSVAGAAAAAAEAEPSSDAFVVAPREERRLNSNGFTVFPCVGTIKGYSKVGSCVETSWIAYEEWEAVRPKLWRKQGAASEGLASGVWSRSPSPIQYPAKPSMLLR